MQRINAQSKVHLWRVSLTTLIRGSKADTIAMRATIATLCLVHGVTTKCEFTLIETLRYRLLRLFRSVLPNRNYLSELSETPKLRRAQFDHTLTRRQLQKYHCGKMRIGDETEITKVSTIFTEDKESLSTSRRGTRVQVSGNAVLAKSFWYEQPRQSSITVWPVESSSAAARPLRSASDVFL